MSDLNEFVFHACNSSYTYNLLSQSIMIITMVVAYFLLSWMSSSSSSITDNGDNNDEDEDIYSNSQCK